MDSWPSSRGRHGVVISRSASKMNGWLHLTGVAMHRAATEMDGWFYTGRHSVVASEMEGWFSNAGIIVSWAHTTASEMGGLAKHRGVIVWWLTGRLARWEAGSYRHGSQCFGSQGGQQDWRRAPPYGCRAVPYTGQSAKVSGWPSVTGVAACVTRPGGRLVQAC